MTCFVPTSSKAITGPCTVKFKVAKYGLLGIYKLKATLANGGKLTVGTTFFLKCTDLHGGPRLVRRSEQLRQRPDQRAAGGDATAAARLHRSTAPPSA